MKKIQVEALQHYREGKLFSMSYGFDVDDTTHAGYTTPEQLGTSLIRDGYFNSDVEIIPLNGCSITTDSSGINPTVTLKRPLSHPELERMIKQLSRTPPNLQQCIVEQNIIGRN